MAEHHGGTGSEVWAWALCDAPLVACALVGFVLGSEPPVRGAIDHLVALVRDNGWPCVVSKELGAFRGPGRKDDPCPFATLAMLKPPSVVDDLRDGPAARARAEAPHMETPSRWLSLLAWRVAARVSGRAA